MPSPTDAALLDRMLTNARARQWWSDRPVPDALLKQIYDYVKWGSTTANSQPARFLFLKSAAEKQRLGPALDPINKEKTLKAPVVTIIAYDPRFYEYLTETYPHKPQARSWYEGKPDVERHALRNGTLQGAYLILVARALGLDCGPMSGFSEEKVNQEFFPDGRLKANFLCSLGYAEGDTLPPRPPRFPFERVCEIR